MARRRNMGRDKGGRISTRMIPTLKERLSDDPWRRLFDVHKGKRETWQIMLVAGIRIAA